MSTTAFVLIAFVCFALFGAGIPVGEKHDMAGQAATCALIIAVLWDTLTMVARWRNRK